MSPTEPVAPAAPRPLPPPRTVAGTTWRCAVTLLTACAAVGAAAAVDARFHIDGATASLPTTVVALLVGLLVVMWLRAAQAWLAVTALSADVCGLSAAALLSRGALRGGHPHVAALTDGTAGRLLSASAALALAVLVVSVVWAAVRGHRRPVLPASARGIGAGTGTGAGAGQA
ncbi:hypothetical protein [Streptomyces montanisoli]|uniref:Uncharacterized protein n=1 Tax=Streptomyces montanisoli TaxID=2798581 RepID=A0A940MC54_9ACTN|nr:hypothetical protein [Streptomyces montanisoli]MBP0456942.1 hypothetical protein [Streptomyces montanisoli]